MSQSDLTQSYEEKLGSFNLMDTSLLGIEVQTFNYGIDDALFGGCEFNIQEENINIEMVSDLQDGENNFDSIFRAVECQISEPRLSENYLDTVFNVEPETREAGKVSKAFSKTMNDEEGGDELSEDEEIFDYIEDDSSKQETGVTVPAISQILTPSNEFQLLGGLSLDSSIAKTYNKLGEQLIQGHQPLEKITSFVHPRNFVLFGIFSRNKDSSLNTDFLNGIEVCLNQGSNKALMQLTEDITDSPVTSKADTQFITHLDEGSIVSLKNNGFRVDADFCSQVQTQLALLKAERPNASESSEDHQHNQNCGAKRESKPVNSSKFSKMMFYYNDTRPVDTKKWLENYCLMFTRPNHIHWRDIYNYNIDENYTYVRNEKRFAMSNRYSGDSKENYYEPLVCRYRKSLINNQVYNEVDSEGLCPYCRNEDINSSFFKRKNSEYLHHVTKFHGVYSNGKEMPLGLLGQALEIKDLKTKGRTETLVDCVECPNCKLAIKIQTLNDGKPGNKFLSYYRHMLTHKQGKKCGNKVGH